MNVLQTIQGLSAKSGGPSTCTFDLMEGLFDLRENGIGCNVDLLTVSSDDILGKGRPWLKEEDDDCKTALAFSKNMSKALDASDYDVYHANALWSYSSHITCKIARKKNKPYVLSPHGMLYPTALAISRWKKWPMLKLWFNKDIHSATCLHATCYQEAEYCRQFGYKGPIAVIPNAVVFPEGVELKSESLDLRDKRGRRIIGFLGRLHPIKKVEQVLYALAKLKCEKLMVIDERGFSTETNRIDDVLCFQIMGKYDEAYEQWLKDEVNRLGLEDCVEFVGFVSGKEKYDRLSRLSALMVPSAQENFGMIVPEALICGTPVYASLGTPWGELNEYHCGWWKDNEVDTIADVIKEILSKSDAELREMGKNGRLLMEEKYEQHIVAGMMKRLYEWIYIGKMDSSLKPKYVYV